MNILFVMFLPEGRCTIVKKTGATAQRARDQATLCEVVHVVFNEDRDSWQTTEQVYWVDPTSLFRYHE